MEDQNILELTDATYSAFMEQTQGVVFIDFYSESCGPCQTLLTFLPRLSAHYKDETLVIAKVNAANNPKLAAKFMVRSLPLTLLVGRDKMVKHAEIGLLSIDAYIKIIDKELGLNQGFFSRLFS
ncbi:MAG: thioredoxin domain-containing protein [Sulfurimonas sp.]|nr:thioredoxin domain-containing protein [Sulfurimonas sp.]